MKWRRREWQPRWQSAHSHLFLTEAFLTVAEWHKSQLCFTSTFNLMVYTQLLPCCRCFTWHSTKLCKVLWVSTVLLDTRTGARMLWNIRFALRRLKPELNPGWGWDETASTLLHKVVFFFFSPKQNEILNYLFLYYWHLDSIFMTNPSLTLYWGCKCDLFTAEDV